MLYETLESHLKVRFEKCHMFMTKVKHCPHILHDGRRCLPPSKVDAIRNWTVTMIRTRQQMNGFLGLVNSYSIYMKKKSRSRGPAEWDPPGEI